MLHLFKRNPKVIILGLAKSGTTAAAHLLQKSTGLSLQADIRGTWYPVNEKLWSNEITFTQILKDNKRAFSRDIVKEPNLTFSAKELLRTFPKTKFLFILRSPFDTIKSQLSRMNLSGDLDETVELTLSHVEDGWKPLFRSQFLQNPSKHSIERLAQVWNFATQMYLESQKEFVVFRYEDFLKNKAKYIVTIVEKLDLIVKTNPQPFVDEQFQPKGSELNAQDFFSEDNLNRINLICRETAQELGPSYKDYLL